MTDAVLVPRVHLAERHLAEVRRLLREGLPGVRVQVFGSRATGRRLKPFSDLDLLLCADQPLPSAALDGLRDAFVESDLPMRVDLVERCDLSPVFLSAIEAEGLVPLDTAVTSFPP